MAGGIGKSLGRLQAGERRQSPTGWNLSRAAPMAMAVCRRCSLPSWRV